MEQQNYLQIDERAIPVDKEGYLEQLDDWDHAVAEHIAADVGIDLTDAHWEIITLLKQFYQQFDHAPNMRVLVKYIQQQTDQQKGNSIYLMQLFPGSTAKIAAKIAGLPRPTHCL